MKRRISAYASQAGFTLLEILVVITIIAILAGVVALSLSGVSQRNLASEAERLQLALQMAADDAIYQGCPMGVALTKNGYGFLRYDLVSRRWWPVDDKALPPRLLQNMQMQLSVGRSHVLLSEVSSQLPGSPSILFSSEGEMTPFMLSLSLPDQGATLILSTDGLSPIQITRDEERQ